jgi:hypothetical protein
LEHTQFVAMVRHKLLSDKQLIYLYNSVIMPKIDYRAQITPLTQLEADRLSAPVKKLIKSKLSLVTAFPDVGLYLDSFYQLANLSHHISRTQIVQFFTILNSSSIASRLLSI